MHAALVSVVTDYQVRYASYSTADLLDPAPILHTVTDHDIETFYSGDINWDRTFRIVATSNRLMADNCRVLDDKTVFLSTARSDSLTPVLYPGLVYREVKAGSQAGSSRDGHLMGGGWAVFTDSNGRPPGFVLCDGEQYLASEQISDAQHSSYQNSIYEVKVRKD